MLFIILANDSLLGFLRWVNKFKSDKILGNYYNYGSLKLLNDSPKQIKVFFFLIDMS